MSNVGAYGLHECDQKGNEKSLFWAWISNKRIDIMVYMPYNKCRNKILEKIQWINLKLSFILKTRRKTGKRFYS